MFRYKRLAFGIIYGLILAVATLAGLEALASLYAPSWPARALRSVPPLNTVTAETKPFTAQPWISAPYNSWGMRDAERTVAKPAGGPPRVAFVGDSFVESIFTPLSLPAAVERQAAAAGTPIEAINLGISGTNPRSYYYRIRDVALELSPDALVLVFYAGNDFMSVGEGYPAWPSLVDESPGSAVLGTLMPRTNWLLVNRLRLSELLRGQPPLGDIESRNDDRQATPDEHVDALVAYVRKYVDPALPPEKIREILSRGDGRLWRVAAKQPDEQEYLLGWMLGILMSWEARDFPVAASPQDAVRMAGDGYVQASLSWIEAADRLARAHGIPLLVFLAPVGSVDPSYVDFWKPWPRAYSWNLICNEWLNRLVASLRQTSVRFVDLRDDLQGVAGTYRKLDGHWSRKGEAIVADRMARELKRLPER